MLFPLNWPCCLQMHNLPNFSVFNCYEWIVLWTQSFLTVMPKHSWVHMKEVNQMKCYFVFVFFVFWTNVTVPPVHRSGIIHCLPRMATTVTFVRVRSWGTWCINDLHLAVCESVSACVMIVVRAVTSPPSDALPRVKTEPINTLPFFYSSSSLSVYQSLEYYMWLWNEGLWVAVMLPVRFRHFQDFQVAAEY